LELVTLVVHGDEVHASCVGQPESCRPFDVSPTREQASFKETKKDAHGDESFKVVDEAHANGRDAYRITGYSRPELLPWLHIPQRTMMALSQVDGATFFKMMLDGTSKRMYGMKKTKSATL
jgi:hypothetical protein